MHYFQVFFPYFIFKCRQFFALGATGFLAYIDGILMSIGLIIVTLLSIIMSLLVSINRQLKRECKWIKRQKGGPFIGTINSP